MNLPYTALAGSDSIQLHVLQGASFKKDYRLHQEYELQKFLPVLRAKPRSRIKSGMTVLGDCEKVTFRHAESEAVLGPSSRIVNPSFERAASRLRAKTR
ncbi:hypothetical protein V513_02235 [Mesotoga sp. H07.pep.5.3]|nr:hypothetical protein V513_02235 [Mesotoga sp. H07.pep.5.3]